MLDVTKRLDAMRCVVCGHRLDGMAGCDSCTADREAAEMRHEDHEDFIEGCSWCEDRAERGAAMWERVTRGY